MFDWLKSWIKNDMQIVLRAKLAFTTTLILAFCLAYWAASWRYGGVIDSYKSALQAQEERHRAELLKKSQPSSLATITNPEFVTLSSNEVTLSGPGHYLVDTENMVESGYLTRISGLSTGDKVTLHAASNDRIIIIKESNYLKMQGPIFYLDNKNNKIAFICDRAGVCVEDSRVGIRD